AQLSFDRNDIGFLTTTVNKPTHNWIGPLGAYLAWALFTPFGVIGYLLPLLFAAFGVAYLLNFLSYLRRRLAWSLCWTFGLLVALTGLVYTIVEAGLVGKWNERSGASSGGGWMGYLSYGESPNYRFGLSLLGRLGAI